MSLNWKPLDFSSKVASMRIPPPCIGAIEISQILISFAMDVGSLHVQNMTVFTSCTRP
jgi:hypothetical protein